MKITIDTKQEIQKAREKVSALQKQIDEENIKISWYHSLEKKEATGAQKKTGARKKVAKRKRFDWTPIYEEIKTILDSKVPLSTKQLIKALEEKGVAFPQVKRSRYDALATRLSAHPSFASHDREGWLLKKEEEEVTDSSSSQ